MGNPEAKGFWRRVAIGVVRPGASALWRHRWSGAEHVPREGGIVVACNHLSNVDPVAVAHFLYVAGGRFPCFLGKEAVFKAPVVGRILRDVGQIPVQRGTAHAVDALEEAIAAVRGGACVVVYPEATLTRDPHDWPMRGKTGVARLALETGAPVVPVASWGAQDVWRRGGTPKWLPRKLIQVTAGPAVDLGAYRDRPVDPDLLHEATAVVMRRIAGLVGELRGETPPDTLFDPAASRSETA